MSDKYGSALEVPQMRSTNCTSEVHIVLRGGEPQWSTFFNTVNMVHIQSKSKYSEYVYAN